MWLEAELAVSPRTELEIVGVAVVNDHSDQVELPAYPDVVVDDETIEVVDSVVLEPDTLELTLLVTDELVVDSAALEVVVDDVLASTVEELEEDKVVLPKIPLEDALLVLETAVVVATSDVEALVCDEENQGSGQTQLPLVKQEPSPVTTFVCVTCVVSCSIPKMLTCFLLYALAHSRIQTLVATEDNC